MKILLAHNYYQQPGGEDIVFAQERELLMRHGHEVRVYERSNHELDGASAARRLIQVQQMISSERTKQEVLSILRSERPDVVHATNTFMMISPSLYEACRVERVPVVQTLHNYRLLCPAAVLFREGKVCEECPEHGLQRSVLHGCYRNSRAMTAAVALMLRVHRQRGTWRSTVAAYVALTEFGRRKFIEGGLPAEKIFVKPNFVEPDPGEREGAGNYALFAGRLSAEKGVRVLLEAWSQLHYPAELRIVGDGPLRAELEQEAAKRGLRHVSFLGRLNNQRVREAIKGAACLIVPSIWYEGFPMVMAESLACGTPILASRLGAMEEIVEDGRNGLLFEAGDAADLARQAEWAFRNPLKLAEMGHEARHDYDSRYSAERNYSLLMHIYEQAITNY